MKLLNATVDTVRRLLGGRREEQHREPSFEKLQEALSYRFSDSSRLRRALTHTSSITPGTASRLESNERLEFLGDAVVNCLVTEHLYRTYPSRSEGQLSRIKSLIVSRKILGEIAATMALGDYLILGYSERKTGGRKRRSVLSNAFEAIVGAMYLDGGLEVCRSFLAQRLFCRIDEFLKDEQNVNYKSRILEMAQRDGFGAPSYTVVDTSGPDHAKQFRVRIDVGGVPMGEGVGSNKKIAQQRAAYIATKNYSKESVTSRLREEEKGAEENEMVSQ